MRAAILNSQSSKVENIIELPDDYDPEEENAYSPPAGHKIETNNAEKALVGGYYRNGIWEPPPPVVIEPTPVVATVQEQIDALTALLVTKGTITQAQVNSIKAPKPTGPPT